ncbi:Alpha/Beta hydrolase protein [Penicillium chermesinum]|uniref:Alpha/Beta hydrolase protein n=1 Tax=Penicillium chermesinum TaxID=63820 RepID=A0A9W9NIG4_9EURO|nr:Alpha/Beta hydrolase protein [Penicillium chermesinum]KAJ5220559.1 Alpha/Beta hydrolase protein [Penicillium chermesinum]KAJ6157985.1 Alpha/Beta hydrolase protein [Penicillium chermesinum]
MTEPIRTLTVPHLGGIEVGFRMSSEVNRDKPTLVMFNPFTTTADYYLPEFKSKKLTESLNLLAIEPLGHGKTTALKTENFTYWDSAIMSLQLLEALEIDRFFALGTSQGGWIAARMTLLAPDKVNIFHRKSTLLAVNFSPQAKGMIILGTSMDSESPKSRELGCWNGAEACSGLTTLAENLQPVDDFEPGQDYCDFLMEVGFGKAIDEETRDFWSRKIKATYRGNEGKKKICMAAVNLAGRDGLHERLPYITCPVLWMQGSSDVVYSVAQAQEDIKRFKNSTSTKLVVCEGGVHFLGRTHGQELQEQLLEFIKL